MNTIALNRTLQPRFKRTQLLPALTPHGLAIPAQTVRVPRPSPFPSLRAQETVAERIVLALLAASAAFSVMYAFTMTLDLLPDWPNLNAWVAQLLC